MTARYLTLTGRMRKSLNSVSGYSVAKVKSRDVARKISPQRGTPSSNAVPAAPKIEISQKARNRGDPQRFSSGRAMMNRTSIEKKNEIMPP